MAVVRDDRAEELLCRIARDRQVAGVGPGLDLLGARELSRGDALGTGLINVAEAKPGDRDFNGGRWAVHPITWAPGVTPVQLTNDHDILAWAEAGLLSIADSPVKLFFCSVSPVPPGH